MNLKSIDKNRLIDALINLMKPLNFTKLFIVGEVDPDLLKSLGSHFPELDILDGTLTEMQELSDHITIDSDVLVMHLFPEESLSNSLVWSAYTQYLGSARLCLLTDQPILNWILQSAINCWFPEGNINEGNLILLSQKDYLLRHPDPKDLSALVELEQLTWPEGVGMTEDIIRYRITEHPNDHLLLVDKDNSIISALYSQKIESIDEVIKQNAFTVDALYKETGSIIQLLALNVNPQKKVEQIGEQLLDLALNLFGLQKDINMIIGVTRWSSFKDFPNITPEKYLHHRNDSGFLIDPVTGMHEKHGAVIKCLVENYRPNDSANEFYGVLVVYDLSNRSEQVKKFQTGNLSLLKDEGTHISRKSIVDCIENAIYDVLGDEIYKKFSYEKPLMDSGFESLSLLQLRVNLESLFHIPLPITFFFTYGTGKKIIEYFINQEFGAYKKWLYKITWRESFITDTPQLEADNSYLVFCNRSIFSENLIDILKQENKNVIRVYTDRYYKQVSETEFFINPSAPNHFRQLINTLKDLPVERVIYAWGLFEQLIETINLEDLVNFHSDSCGGLLYLTQAISAFVLEKTPSLLVINYGVAYEGDDLSLADWPLNGLCKAIIEEHSELKCKRITIDKKSPVREKIDQILIECAIEDLETDILWRNNKRYVSRWQHETIEEVNLSQLSSDQTYLITGGLSEVGLGLAHWHIQHGAKHLVLIDQSPLTSDAIQGLDKLKTIDVNIETFQVDIADFDALEIIFNQIKKNMPPLKGIMHVAGVIDDDLIMHLSWDRFSQVYALKVAGSWNLHLLTKTMQLDYFHLSSSVLADLAPIGKANHAFCTAFCESLAFYRRNLGLPAKVINWGPWSFRDVPVQHRIETQLRRGIKTLSMNDGLNLVSHLFCSEQTQIIAAQIDWPQFLENYSIDKPILQEIVKELGFKKSSIIDDYKNAPIRQRYSIVENFLALHIRRLLGLNSNEQINKEINFAELGLDVQNQVELRKRIQSDFGEAANLPLNILHKHHNFKSLSHALIRILDNSKPSVTVKKQKFDFEPIAVIGMACRMPCGVETPDDFYNFLISGKDAVTEVPKERWDLKKFYNPDKNTAGTTYSKYGSFVNNIDLFDASFFGISPRESVYIDPQSRFLLKTTWEALENAGISPDSLADTKTSVFSGISTGDYSRLLYLGGIEDMYNAYIGTGNISSAVVGRVSNALGLQGPNMAIDTACSSSLVALHLACQSLLTQESDTALAGGVQLNSMPTWFINFSKANMLSVDGHCKTFDASANGYVRGEGCGIVVLKRLSDAIADGDNIRAIIRSTAVNQDGFSSGFTVPNGQAQIALIKSAIKKSGVSELDISYIEAHGTGTALGDPIEVNSIAETYGKKRDKDSPLLLGSVKSNIGHLEAAAGIAGVIKVILSLQHKKIPKNLNFRQLNPHIDLDFPAKIVVENEPWDNSNKKRVAGVSAFGFSGTNAHVIIEEAPIIESQKSLFNERPLHILTISAKTEQALADLIKRHDKFIQANSEIELADYAYTANVGRNHFKYRVAIIARTCEELIRKIHEKDYLSGSTALKIKKTIHFNFMEKGAYHTEHVDEFNERIHLTSEMDWGAALHSLAESYTTGFHVNWKEFDKPFSRHKLVIPTYPFQERSYWVEISETPISRREFNNVHHLLGERIDLANGNITFNTALNLNQQNYLKDHQVFERVIFPGAGYLEMAIAASTLVYSGFPVVIKNFSIEAALQLTKESSLDSQVILTPSAMEDSYEFSIYTNPNKTEGVWQTHARGVIKVEKLNIKSKNIDEIKSLCPKELDVGEFYRHIQKTGISYGPAFQTIKRIFQGERDCFAELKLALSDKSIVIHPAMLDGTLQMLFALLNGEDGTSSIYLPVGLDVLSVNQRATERVYAHLHLTEDAKEVKTVNVYLYNEDQQLIASMENLTYRRTEAVQLEKVIQKKPAINSLFYQTYWQPKAILASEPSKERKKYLVFANDKMQHGLLETLQTQTSSIIVTSQQHPKNKEEFLELLRLHNSDDSLAGILHLATMGPILSEENITVETIELNQKLGTTSLLHLSQAMLSHSEEGHNTALYLFTQGTQLIDYRDCQLVHTPLLGFKKSITLENPNLNIVHIDFDVNCETPLMSQLILDEAAIDVIEDDQVLYRDDIRFVAKFSRQEEIAKRGKQLSRPEEGLFRLKSREEGLLENLELIPLELLPDLKPNEVEIEVHAVGLNFRDVLNALGLYPGDPGSLGGDCSGRIIRVGKNVNAFKPGDDVLGMVKGCLASKAQVNENLIIKKPKNLTMEQASTIPTIYLTAYYALVELGKLKSGDNVLIHAGAGGVGQAAIQIAKYLGAVLFSTAGNDRKREFLKSLGVDHVMDSRSPSYGKDIENITHGRGVDLVLNCLSSEGFIQVTVNACQKNARFLEIGKRDIWTKEQMKEKRPDIEYHIIALDDIAENNPEKIKELFTPLMQLFFDEKIYPVMQTVFPIERAIMAFKYMKEAKHIGKVVITQPPLCSLAEKLDKNASYLITGGLGGLGLRLLEKLINAGARHLVLTSRRSPDAATKKKLAAFKNDDITIEVYPADVGEHFTAKALLETIIAKRPLKGIFHLAGVLDDALLSNQDWLHFETTFSPKVYGSWLLHQLSKQLDIQLDYFVMFSSIASSMGSRGQSNYAAANSFMDGLAFFRRAKGLPALSINWGPWADAGMAAQLSDQHLASGWKPLKIDVGMNAIESLLENPYLSITVADIDWDNYTKSLIKPESWLADLTKRGALQQKEAVLIETLSNKDKEEQISVISIEVTKIVREILNLQENDEVDAEVGFFEMGLDSLMAVEFKNRLQLLVDQVFTVNTAMIFNAPTVSKMASLILNKLNIQHESETIMKKTDPTPKKEIEKMTEEELLETAKRVLEENFYEGGNEND